MLVLLITSFSLALVVTKSMEMSPRPQHDMSLLSPFALCREFLRFLARRLGVCSEVTRRMASFKRKRYVKVGHGYEEAVGEPSILDLPELALECILSKLQPVELRNMGGVCRDLRERCHSDYYWERHMKEKWGRVAGGAARKKWEHFLASEKASTERGLVAGLDRPRQLLAALSHVWPLSLLGLRIKGGAKRRGTSLPLDDSLMSWYLAMESGQFWFPAQVYNREHGHVGFLLSCYDAELSYDIQTDTFRARYLPHGRRTMVVEEGVQWDRIRAPPVDTSPHDLHVSDCLSELRPGDHIEIQWRRNKEFPYGWWYGVVGHLESCDGNEHFCQCHLSDVVMLQFNQYTLGSRWRQMAVGRKDHREEGNENNGFYGGIRKLWHEDEISKWKQLWPTDVLE